MRCCTVLVIVPITQPGLSSSLSLPSSVSSSSSSSPSSPSSELARSLRLSPIAMSISSNVFRALWMSIPRFQHALYRAALVEPLPLHLQLAFLPQRFLSQHNPQSISLSLHCLRSAFLVAFPPQASFWISSCAIPQGLGRSPPGTRSCLHSLNEIVMLTALSICRFCQPGVAKRYFSEHCPLYFAWTLLLGETLDVASYG